MNIDEFVNNLPVYKFDPPPEDWKECVNRIFDIEGSECSYALLQKNLDHYGFNPSPEKLNEYFIRMKTIHRCRNLG